VRLLEESAVTGLAISAAPGGPGVILGLYYCYKYTLLRPVCCTMDYGGCVGNWIKLEVVVTMGAGEVAEGPRSRQDSIGPDVTRPWPEAPGAWANGRALIDKFRPQLLGHRLRVVALKRRVVRG